MAAGRYNLTTIDPDGTVFESPPMDVEDALLDLMLTRMLHVLGSWRVDPCDCGLGIEARKGDQVRLVHLMPADEDEATEVLVAAFPMTPDPAMAVIS